MGNNLPLHDIDESGHLSLENQELTRIPIETLLNSAKLLISLDLKQNHITSSIPLGFSRLNVLRKLSLSHNRLTTVPKAVLKLRALENLDLGFNQIKRLPDNFFDLNNLMVFDIRHNPLNALPSCLNHTLMPNLSFVCIWGCRLDISNPLPGVEPDILSGLQRQHIPQEVIPRLWLGSAESATSLYVLQKRRVTHVLCLAANIPPSFPNNFIYYTVRVNDSMTSQISEHFEAMCRFITDGRRSGGVLVHCREGISRSATAVIAYLMQRRGLSCSEAHQLTLSARHVIKPNRGFWEQLQAYEEKLIKKQKKNPYSRTPSPSIEPPSDPSVSVSPLTISPELDVKQSAPISSDSSSTPLKSHPILNNNLSLPNPNVKSMSKYGRGNKMKLSTGLTMTRGLASPGSEPTSPITPGAHDYDHLASATIKISPEPSISGEIETESSPVKGRFAPHSPPHCT